MSRAAARRRRSGMIGAFPTGIDQALPVELPGLPANFLRRRLIETEAMRADDTIGTAASAGVRQWQRVCSAGDGVGQVCAVEPVTAIADRLLREYHACTTA